MPRSGSPSYWAPHLGTPTNGRPRPSDQRSKSHLQAYKRLVSYENVWNILSPIVLNIGPHTPNLSGAPAHPCPCAPTHEGETALGISHIGRCHGKSYSGQLPLTADLQIIAVHSNGRHSGLDEGDHAVILLMTCTPLTVPEDLKVLIREGISKICPLGNVPIEYEGLRFCLAPRELGTHGHCLLVGLSTSSGTHMRLRDVLLH